MNDELVTQEAKELTTPGLMDQFAEFAGAGSENVTADAMAIPFVTLMQAKSPEVESDPDDFKPGMLLHKVTGKRYDIREKGGKPLQFVQCHFYKQIVEWGDAEAGNKGLKARHPCTPAHLAAMEKLPRNAKGKILAPNNPFGPFPSAITPGNLLEETAYHFWLAITLDGIEAIVMPLKSTGLTPSKKLMRMLNDRPMGRGADGKPFKMPHFSTILSVQSFLDRQKSGGQNTFQNVRFEKVGELTDPAIFLAAADFYRSIQGGAAVIDDSQEESTSSAAHTETADTGSDDGVPF